MDRRDFFRRGISRVAEKFVTKTDENLTRRAMRWIRPPYAKPELDFLLACTRCMACAEACRYEIIFPLSAKNGADVMSTPALDLSNSGCHLCADWPCVEACTPQALLLVVDNKRVNCLPQFAIAVIDPELCIAYLGPECGACAASCTVESALNWTREQPSIDHDYCIGCAMCREQCVTDPKAINIMKL